MFFSRASNRETVYDPVFQEETSKISGSIEEDTELRPQLQSSAFKRDLGWILFIIACILHLTHLIFIWKTPESRCFDDKTFDVPVIWEERTFLSNIYGDEYDVYSRDNPNVDEAWNALLIHDGTYITEEEMRRLPAGQRTAKAPDGVGYIIITEVFHQIHCLNALRKNYYNGKTELEVKKGFEEPGSHSDHCFSYLLQNLLCHADVGSMMTRWDEEEHMYHANYNVTKTCRNYDAIREWAADRKPVDSFENA